MSRSVTAVFLASIVALAAITHSPLPGWAAEAGPRSQVIDSGLDRPVPVPLECPATSAPGESLHAVLDLAPMFENSARGLAPHIAEGATAETLAVVASIADAYGPVLEASLIGLLSANGRVAFATAAPLAEGEYALTIAGLDRSGRPFVGHAAFRVQTASALQEGPALAVTRALAFPNPFDPAQDGPVTIRWEQSRDASDVTIEVYDFAGDLVARLPLGPVTAEAARTVGAFWHGVDHDGTTVADGGYLAHIVVRDAGGSTSADVKIAVRRR